MKIIEWIKGVKVGTDGYELQEFEKPDGGVVREKELDTFRLDTGGSTTIIEGISAVASSSNQLRCSVKWDSTPKIPTGQITIEEPNASFSVRDGSAISVNLTSLSYTVSGTQIFGNRVQFNIDVATGTPFASLSNSGLVFVGASTNGSGKITIT